jgi:anti-sigma-K factor RskA
VITHDHAHDLLGAFALDAVEDFEHDEIESHIRDCPRCATELMGLRDVASALGNCVESVPEGLWSMISSQLGTAEQEQPPPSLVQILSRNEANENDARPAGRAPRSRAGRRYLIVVTSVAAAAAAAACVLGVSVARTSDENNRLQAQIGTNSSSSVVAALETPGHTLLSLRGTNHRQFAQFVLLPSGRGYLVSSSLPKLTADHTYQLWGVIGGQAISLGLLGPAPSQAAFTVDASAEPSQLGVTVEPPGGSVVPTSAMLASSSTHP